MTTTEQPTLHFVLINPDGTEEVIGNSAAVFTRFGDQDYVRKAHNAACWAKKGDLHDGRKLVIR